MWQVAVAAAVAGGSGFIAKHFFSPNSHTLNTTQTEPKQQLEQEQLQPHQISSNSIQTLFLPIETPAENSALNQNESDNASRNAIHREDQDGVFRFSCSGSRSDSKKSRNLGNKIRGNNKKLGSFDDGSVCQRNTCGNSGKKVGVCLKRRKTTRNSTGKRHSSLSKDCSTFGWGLGLGIICMMSAGKTEISKLSSTIDETAKVVDEMKSQLNKRKSAPCHHYQLLNSDDTITMDTVQKPASEQTNIGSCPMSKLSFNTKVISHLADSDYPSSVLTEEQHEGVEMDQLEAELESELQKLSWCTTETSEHVENLTMAQIGRHQSENQSSTSYQSDGVSPVELTNKLSNLLIQQQESHISELESELNLAQSKLQQKDDELRALKDCVRRLTQVSLSTVSDEETEEGQGEILDHKNTMVADNVMVGMKRAFCSQHDNRRLGKGAQKRKQKARPRCDGGR
ncbi:protein POLAR-like 1 isoform X2 [Beta vulgaris subsp. vulgaris]|uniref:protein POLAR-like 1 isoform X2 n=1 Tax=Beta vulgaris subsp. vulgaris TaxID=3555 RepID=UPI002036DBAF|nr:protein POLAR-like 1 isoform X2 [Beta vulgaris subsp. vulgaris]